MSSYHSKFTYLNKSSRDDLHWLIVHFDPDNGETDSYLTQEQIYSDSYNGARRTLYGTKWTEVAIVKITVIKEGGGSFSLAECREAYRWLTGNPSASWLDMYVEDNLLYSFMCTVQDVKPHKVDARTVGLNIYFESISPWAYSPVQTVSWHFGRSLELLDGGVLSIVDENTIFNIDDNGVISSSKDPQMTINSDDGTAYFNSQISIEIDNPTDDPYSYVYMNMVLKNKTCPKLSITNATIGEESIISGIDNDEIVTIDAKQFIFSDKENKIFRDNFNYIWPKLKAGFNDIIINGHGGEGYVELSYRYPIKAGDCAIDVTVDGDRWCCTDVQEMKVNEQDLRNMLRAELGNDIVFYD